jgi:hypothetical protein
MIDLASWLGVPRAFGALSLLFPKDGRVRLIDLPTEEIIRARPCMDLDIADLTVETAGMLVWMRFLCRNVSQPAIGAVEIFGRPNATGHTANMPRRSAIFQPVRLPQSNARTTQGGNWAVWKITREKTSWDHPGWLVEGPPGFEKPRRPEKSPGRGRGFDLRGSRRLRQ